jgi:hypothetical protein
MLLLVSAILLLTVASVQAQGVCESNYGDCMAACATDRMPERCMQRCISKRSLCAMPLIEASVPSAPANKSPAVSGASKPKRPVVQPAGRTNENSQRPGMLWRQR